MQMPSVEPRAGTVPGSISFVWDGAETVIRRPGTSFSHASPARGQRIARGAPANVVAALRAALRGQDRTSRHAVEAAAAPLIDACQVRLLRACDHLARSAPHTGWEGADLASEAWEKTLRYLAGVHGDRVQDAEHFERLLLRAARSRFLDILDACSGRRVEALDEPLGEGPSSATRGDRLPDPAATPEEWLLLSDGLYLLLVEELFLDAPGFHRKYHQKDQRHPRQYQAFVLYQIACCFREEAGVGETADPRMAGCIRRWVHLLGVPEPAWKGIETAAMAPDGGDGPLFAAVNLACGTNLRSRATVSVLRHEMNKFAAQRGRQQVP